MTNRSWKTNILVSVALIIAGWLLVSLAFPFEYSAVYHFELAKLEGNNSALKVFHYALLKVASGVCNILGVIAFFGAFVIPVFKLFSVLERKPQ